MRRRPGSPAILEAAGSFLAHPRFVTALTAATIGTAACAFAIRQLIGWAGLVAILIGLVVLAGASLFARRDTIAWQGLLPVSLLVFVGWAGISVFWSSYQWATVAGLAYLGAFTVLGIYVALLRDTIQVVRAYGDVLRFVLAVSLAIEILAGVLIDSPIPFLGILGDLDRLGPLQGILGSRNQLGIIAVVAIVTFGTEYRTRSVRRGLAIGSLALAALVLLLARSPVAFGGMLVVLLAAAALYGLRRTSAERRRVWQFVLLGVSVVGVVVAWASRAFIVVALNATGELTYRLDLWRRAWDLIAINPLQGWGWIGAWRTDIVPFVLFGDVGSRVERSASNAFVDVWFQLGLVGLAIFLGLVGLAFVRSWLLASGQRSVVFAWPALVLVALVITALAESSILVEFGWLTFVACTVKAAEQLSWRQAFAATGRPTRD